MVGYLVLASRRLLSRLSSWVCKCYVVCHPGGHISLNIIERITPKSKIFTETRAEDSFRVCDLSSCNLLSETNNFILYAVLSCLGFKLLEPSPSELEPRIFFVFVILVSVIFSPKQTILFFAPFCHA
jgi:hypothetical protein